MRRITVPSDAFFQASPISCSTRYHDDPSGARVAILTTIGAACAGETASARIRRTAAARLFQEQLIHPPFQPACLSLRHEVGQPVPGGFPAGIECERPVQKPQKLYPVLRP